MKSYLREHRAPMKISDATIEGALHSVNVAQEKVLYEAVGIIEDVSRPRPQTSVPQHPIAVAHRAAPYPDKDLGFVQFKTAVGAKVPLFEKHMQQPNNAPSREMNALIFAYWWQYKHLHPLLYGKLLLGKLPDIKEEGLKVQRDWVDHVLWASEDVEKLLGVFQQGHSEDKVQKVIVSHSLERIYDVADSLTGQFEAHVRRLSRTHRHGRGLSAEEQEWVERKWQRINARREWAEFRKLDFWQSPTVLPDGLKHPNEHRAVLKVYDNGFLGVSCLKLVRAITAADSGKLTPDVDQMVPYWHFYNFHLTFNAIDEVMVGRLTEAQEQILCQSLEIIQKAIRDHSGVNALASSLRACEPFMSIIPIETKMPLH